MQIVRLQELNRETNKLLLRVAFFRGLIEETHALGR